MGSDASNEHRLVQVCGDDTAAVDQVAQLARDIGFAVNNTGALRNARDLEAIPLYLFRGWGWPTFFTIGLFIFEMIYLFIAMYVLVDRYELSMIPTYVMYKASGAVCVNLLAFCYLPGVLAAFVQIYNGSKHTRFQTWLDKWMQGRKQLGIYALLFAFLHMITVMSCMNGAYFTYLFKTPYVTVPLNATADMKIPVDTKMNLHGEGCILSGLIAITAMSIIGLTSVPAIGSLMNWREWRFIQSQFGFICFLLTVGHCMVHGVARWTVQRDLPLRNSFMSLLLPWLTIALKIIYFIPCVHVYVWKIRGGYERGVQYDTEKGEQITCITENSNQSIGFKSLNDLQATNLDTMNESATIIALKPTQLVPNGCKTTDVPTGDNHDATKVDLIARTCTANGTARNKDTHSNGYVNHGFKVGEVAAKHGTSMEENNTSGERNIDVIMIDVSQSDPQDTNIPIKAYTHM